MLKKTTFQQKLVKTAWTNDLLFLYLEFPIFWLTGRGFGSDDSTSDIQGEKYIQ